MFDVGSWNKAEDDDRDDETPCTLCQLAHVCEEECTLARSSIDAPTGSLAVAAAESERTKK